MTVLKHGGRKCAQKKRHKGTTFAETDKSFTDIFNV